MNIVLISKIDVNIDIFRLNIKQFRSNQKNTNINKISVDFLLVPQKYYE